jgi:hypothetical protein
MEGKKEVGIGSGDKAYHVMTLSHTMTLTEARMQKVVFLHDHKPLVNTHQIATIYSLSPYPAHKNAKSKSFTMSAIYPNRTMQNDLLSLLVIFPIRPPRLTRLPRIITMLIRTNQLLLINTTMDLPITSGKPS